MKTLTVALCLAATPVLAQNTITETQLGGQIVANNALAGTAGISVTNPWNATIRIIPGSACAPNSCPLSFMEVGFNMASFASTSSPICTATLSDGAFYFNGKLQEADPWPTGTMLTVDRDSVIPSSPYMIRMYGPPLGNPTLKQPAAVFTPGTELRVNVMCGSR